MKRLCSVVLLVALPLFSILTADTRSIEAFVATNLASTSFFTVESLYDLVKVDAAAIKEHPSAGDAN